MSGADPGEVTPGRRRRRWVVAAVVLVLAVGGAAFAVLWSRGSADEVRLDEVRRPTGTSLPAEAAVLRPPQGVYLYRGSGTDRLSTPPKEQAQGPEMPASVTHRDDGCWTFRIDYSTNHWQTWDYCPTDGGLDEAGGTTFQRWDFVVFVQESESTFDCDAPTVRADQEPGDTWAQSCTGSSTGTEGTSSSEGPYRYEATETIEIGGQQVEAHRYHRERTMSGSQRGTETSEVWFSAETGMPLRNERQIEVRTDTVIGEVTYSEVGDFELTSLEPTA